MFHARTFTSSRGGFLMSGLFNNAPGGLCMYRNVNIFISIVIISSRCNAEVFIVDPDFEFVSFELVARHHELEAFEPTLWPIELFRTRFASRWVADMPLKTHCGRASELWRCHESQDLPLASMTPCSSSTSY
jgi:hypothetical protein